MEGALSFGLKLAGARYALGLVDKIKNKWNYTVGPARIAVIVKKKKQVKTAHFFVEHHPGCKPFVKGDLFLTWRGVLVLRNSEKSMIFNLARTRFLLDHTGSFLIQPDQRFERYRIQTLRRHSWFSILSGLAPARVIRDPGYENVDTKDVIKTIPVARFSGNMKNRDTMCKEFSTARLVNGRGSETKDYSLPSA